MTILVSGNERGLLDSSLLLLDRSDRTQAGDPGNGEQIYVNVSNGNLIIQHTDAFLPSLGDDYALVRTYNSRGKLNDSHQHESPSWIDSNSIRLSVKQENGQTFFVVQYGEGSVFDYRFDAARGLYVSTDGAGAFETIEDLHAIGNDVPAYRLTRADQTVFAFDSQGRLLTATDTNGVTTTFFYKSDRLIRIFDDSGHAINYFYDSGNLVRVEDETQGVLASYVYAQGRLVQSTDRAGHVTTYEYTSDGELLRITLPSQQTVGSTVETYATRQISIEYTTLNWESPPATVVTRITDANGGVTTFDYQAIGATRQTRVVDPLGNARATSNAAVHVAWRIAHGFYATYSATNPAIQAQVEQIRTLHSLTYTTQANGYITDVRDAAGFHTNYTYDTQNNLASITDRNGFTTTFTYDAHGNLLSRTDNEGNVTSFTYTAFDKVASQTSAVGSALVTSDDAESQTKRVELGYAALVADLSAADVTDLRALYTTTFEYDSHQNLVTRVDAGGDITRFEYDANGNLSRQIVLLDPTVVNPDDPGNAAKVEITQHFYDAFGNVVRTLDAEGNESLASYDHFGNLTRYTDGNGGVTQYTYDGDNRLLSVTDPEGHTSTNAYDAVGNRIRTTDASGHTVTQVFDRNNLLVGTLDPSTSGTANRSTTTTYDEVGNEISTTDAEGRTTTRVYDANRRLIEVDMPQVLDADDQPVSYRDRYEYDAEGNLITLTDPNGQVTRYLHTPNGLLKQITSALGNITQYLYDPNGNQLQILIGAQLAPALQRRVRFSYDEEDQQTTAVDALGHVTRHSYDAPGNVVSITDANDHTTDFEYDRNNRRVREIRPSVVDPVTGLPTRYTVVHAYDANGNETATTENGHTEHFTFDKDNRRVLFTDANDIKTVYRYDSRDNVTEIAVGVDAHVDTDGHIVIDDASGGAVTTRAYDEFNQLVAQTDGVGNALVLSDKPLYQQMRVQLGFHEEVDDLTDGEKAALLEKFTRHFAYDKVGNLVRETDHLDHVTNYVWDALDRMQSQSQTVGSETFVTSFRYDGRDRVVKTRDPLGRTFDYQYDALGRLTDVTDSKGVVTHHVYDAFGNTTATTRAFDTTDARTTHFEYDLENRLTKTIDAESNETRYDYDFVGNRIRVTDANNGVTQYFYDALNRKVKVIDPLTFETRYEYDAADNLISIIDPKGVIERLQYDPGNRYIQTTDREGRITRFDYDVLGHVVTRTTAMQRPAAERQVTQFVYDAEGNLREVHDAENNVSLEDYDANYNQIASTDGNGNVTHYGYDAFDRVIRIENPLGGERTFEYDAVGNRLSETDERLNKTTYTYDENNRLITVTDPLDVVTQYAYDKVGNRITVTRALGTPAESAHHFAYDGNDRLVRSTDALGNATQYVYDGNGNRTQVIDANDHATLYGYDADNRVETITDPLTHVTRFTYDKNGNRVQVTDPLLRKTTNYYNKDNELVLTADALGFATENTYDGNGNLVSTRLYATALTLPLDPAVKPTPTASTADQVTTFDYDKLGRVTKKTDALGYATTFVYDAVGNVLRRTQQLSLTMPTLVATTRNAYDGRNDLVRKMTAEGYVTLYTYDAVGNLKEEKAFDGKSTPTATGDVPSTGTGTSRTTTYTYDNADRLTDTKSPLLTVTHYEYDKRGNRTAKVEAFGDPLQRRSEVHYDAADRVVEVVDALGIVTRTERDAVGNEIAVHEAYGRPEERITRYTHDANNQVVTEVNALGIKTENTWDAAGNLKQRVSAVGLTEERTEKFEYDAQNQLTAEENGAGNRTEYAYDGAGNKVRVTVAPTKPGERINRFRYDLDNRLIAQVDGNGVETAYRYDGAGNKLETIQLAAAYDAAGNPVTTYGGVSITGKDRHTLFTYDKDDRLLSVKDPLNGLTTYEYDALGNQTKITDAGNTVTQNTFDAEGRLLTNKVLTGQNGGVLVANVYDVFGNVVRSRQGFADGTDTRQTTYAYDKLDRRVLVTEFDRLAVLSSPTAPTSAFAQAFSTAFAYDVFGNQTSLSHGLYLVPSSDAAYDATKALRAQPLVASFRYDDLDRLVESRDGAGNPTFYKLDAFGNRVEQTTGFFKLGRTVHYTYDGAGRLTRRETGEGSRVDFAYDQAGNQISQSLSGDGAAARVTTYTYDGNGRMIAEVDPLLTKTRHILDAFGNEIETHFASTTTDERIVKAEFDKNNGRIADVDALGNRTTYVLDKMGNRIKETDALGYVTWLYYNGLNQQTGTLSQDKKDAAGALQTNGYLTTFERDSAGNVVATRIYMNRYAVAADGTPTAPGATDPVRTTTNAYDGSNDLIKRTASDGIVTDYLRNSAGKLIQLTTNPSTDTAARARTADLTPRVQKFEFDAAGRLVKFVETDGTIETYAYDSSNNRVRTTVTNPNPTLVTGATDPVRTTLSYYDRDNHLVLQTTDPTGLALKERLAYDAAGNVVRKTDAKGQVTTSTYDDAGRLIEVKDPLGFKTKYGYDRVGNRTSVTDARNNVTNIEYDKDNRVVLEKAPAVDVFTIAGGAQASVRPEFKTEYDAVGNVIRTTDENGFVTTYWYDGSGNTVAQVNGDNVLRTYTHDATGAQLSATLYMKRVDASAHDPTTLPTPPSDGEVRTVSGEYDAAGRSTRTIFPQIYVTTLSGTNTSDPTATSALATPDEKNLYDAFGERVESFDRDGNRSLAYYDRRGRVVLTADAAGYVIQSFYDDQSNLIRQRKFATALNAAGLSAANVPDLPLGDVAVVDRTYDAANRLLEELSPAVQLDGSTERISTRFAYDANGNQIRKTLAAGTTEAAVEYSYFDADNRLEATVTTGRVLVTFDHDGVGNRTALKRFANVVPPSVDLATATRTSLLAAVTADSAKDQETTLAYDALGRQTSQTDQMGPGTADNIVTSTSYDKAGNATKRTDQLGNATLISYDANRHALETRSPDGNRSFVKYDAAGLKVQAWTGDLGTNEAAAATISTPTVKIGSDLAVAWTVSSSTSSELRSYVVYDTSSHNTPSDYLQQSARVGMGAVSVHIPLTGFSVGTTVYYRVVTVDVAGSTAWTAERSITIPVRVSALSVTKVGSDLKIRVTFDGTVATSPAPVVNYGPKAGPLSSTATLTLQTDGSYLATITAPADPQALAYTVGWSDSGGAAYVTAQANFEAPGTHAAEGSIATVQIPTLTLAAGSTQIVVIDGASVTAARTNNLVQFAMGSLGTGSHVSEVYYGNPSATDSTLTITQHDHQVATPGTPFDIPGGKRRTFTYAHNYETHVSVAFSATEAGNVTTGSMKFEYRAVGATGAFSSTTLTKSGNTFSTSSGIALQPGSYDVRVVYVDSNGKTVIVAWRRLNVVTTTLAAPFNQDDTTLPYDFAGQQSSFTSDAPPTVDTVTGRSLTVTASETDGTITKPASGAITVDPGLYTGPVDPNAAPVTLSTPVNSSSSGSGSHKSDGLVAATYFTEILYDGLGQKIGTNEDDGVWRRLDVDANGNAVRTRSYGIGKRDDANQAPTATTGVVTFAAFDVRDLEIANWGAKVAVDTDGDGTNEATLERAVTRKTYDYDARLATQLDPFPGAMTQQFKYDLAGNLIRQTDSLGNATVMAYDRRGHEVKRTDPLDHVRKKEYDNAGRMVKEIDALNKTTIFAYDSFDRVTKITDPLGHFSTEAYDQHDRLIQETDGNSFTTKYTWDKRDQMLWVQDEGGNFFGQAFDVMGRVTHRYAFQGGSPANLAEAMQAVTDSSSALRPFLVDEATKYDIFGNKQSETDAMGRVRTYTYGAFGRLETQTDEGGRVYEFGYDDFGRQKRETRTNDGTTRDVKDIRSTYDDAGRLTQVKDYSTDAVTAGVTTDYTYDVAGRRAHEKLTAPGLDGSGNLTASTTVERSVKYGYDATGRMTSWTDSVTTKNLTYQYDAAGNQRFVTGSGTDHEYKYDEDDRIKEIWVDDALQQSYTYDDAGNRKTHAIGGVTTTYTYDAGDRLTGASNSSGTVKWTYDNSGNVTRYSELDSGGGTKYDQINTYSQNYRQLTSDTTDNRDADDDNHSHTVSTNEIDKSGRLNKVTSVNKTDPDHERTTIFKYSYTADGREGSVTNISDQNNGESSSSQYDANDKLFYLNLGQGQDNERSGFKKFVHNSDGQIFARFFDDGEDDTPNSTLTQFLYGNGNIVGEVGNDTNSAVGSYNQTLLDQDHYNLVKNINADFPGASSTGSYVVQPGDTLQVIASRMYGNPSLWFVIADANGLSGSEALKEGTRLEIPLRIEQGRITAETHVVYSDSDIVGATVPNLKTPPMSAEDTCKLVAAIILIIVVAIAAIAATVFTVGLAAPAAAAFLGFAGSVAATIIAGVVIGAAVGATLGFVAGVITQGILIGFGLQREFDWNSVAADVVGGAIGGIAAGISAGVSLAAKIGQIAARVSLLIRLGVETALNVAGEVSSQLIQYRGRIEQPWMIGVAAAGGIAGELIGEFGGRAFRAVKRALGIGAKAADTAGEAARAGGKVVKFVEKDGTVVSKLTKDVGFDAVDEFSPLKEADIAFSSPSSKGKLSLEIKNADELFEAGGKTHLAKPGTWTDDAGSSVSAVQSPVKLDVSADAKAIKAATDLNAGVTGKFAKESIVDSAEKTVGKVSDKTVPVEEASGVLSKTTGKKIASTADDAVAVPPSLGATARKPSISTVTAEEVLEEAVKFKRKNLPKKALEITDLENVKFDDPAYKNLKNAIEKLQAIKSETEVFSEQDQAIKKLLAKSRGKATAVAKDGLPRYNDISDVDLPKLRQKLKDYLGKTRYEQELDEIAKKVAKDPRLNDVDPVEVLGSRLYTFDPSNSPDIYDVTYKGLNLPLLGVGGKTLTDADPFIRLASRGLDYLPEFHGTTLRGFKVDATTGPAADFIAKFKKGAIVASPAFNSSSVSSKTAIGFASGAQEEGVMFVTNIRKGHYVNPVHETGGEFEIVNPPNTQFKVLDVVEIDPRKVSAAKPVLGFTDGTKLGKIKKIIYLDEVVTDGAASGSAAAAGSAIKQPRFFPVVFPLPALRVTGEDSLNQNQ